MTKLLKLPQHVLPLFGLCLGWPADNPDLKPRLPASILVHENSYQPLDKDALAQYDEQLAEYYLTRGSNNRRDTGAIISAEQSLKKAAHLFWIICTNRVGRRAKTATSMYDTRAFDQV